MNSVPLLHSQVEKKWPEVELFSAKLRTGAYLRGKDIKPLKIGVCKAKGCQKKYN